MLATTLPPMRRLAAALRSSPELVPGVIAAAVFVALAASEGGFKPTAWYPAALFTMGLVVLVVLVLGRAGRLVPSAGSRLAIALLAAFTAWAFLSIVWAEVPGDAWDGANRTLLYLLAFVLFALLPWRGLTGAIVLGGHSVAIGVLALVTVGDLAGAADPVLGLIGGRLAEPTGYHNATAALLLSAFFPALLLASRRELPWWGRGPLLAAAGVCLEVAVLPQSRGSLIAFPLVALLFVALAPGRARLVLVVAPVALATYLASGPLLDVYSIVRDQGDVRQAFDDAYGAVLLSAGALLVFGCLLGAGERLLTVPPRAGRYLARAVGALTGIVAVVGIVVALNATGDPVDWVDERWEDFTSGQDTSFDEGSRFTGSLGTNRYDYWRVAMNGFADDPVIGLGMDQFAVDYVRERRSDEEPFNPHSIGVKIVSQTGLVGTVLFFGFLVAAVAGALRSRVRGAASLDGAVAAAGLVAFGYWLTHGFGDWLWEMPGLSAPVFAWLAIAGTLGGSAERGAGSPRPGAAAMAAGGALALVAAASFVLPWGAARDVEIAAEHWPANPAGALDRLERAHDLNPLSDEADVVAGTIAVRAAQPQRAAAYFARALERNPASWYSELMLATLEARDGRRASAAQRLRRARVLTPRDPLVRKAQASLRAGRPLSFAAIDRSLLRRICSRLGRTSATPDCE